MSKYTFIKEFSFDHPDVKRTIRIEIWQDNEQDYTFAVDSIFLDKSKTFFNPFNGECEVIDVSLPAQ
jgi:hypothetical protein